MKNKTILLLLAVTIALGLAAVPAPASPAGEFLQGEKDVLTLTGSPEEMGERYGRYTAKLINRNLELFWEEAQKKGLSREQTLDEGKAFEDYMLQSAPAVIDEIQSMAIAAGVSYRELLAFNALEDLVFDDGCSNMLATGEATIDGKAYFHKNRDLRALPEQVLIVRINEDHYDYIGIASAGHSGVAIGINEHGVSTGNTALTTWDTGDGYANLTINRMILESSSSASEAVDVILDVNRRSGSNYHVADSSEAVFVETSHSAAGVRWVVDEAIANTNHYTLPEMLIYENLNSTDSSEVRRSRADELLQASFGEIDVDTMVEISQDQHGSIWLNRSITIAAGTFDGSNLMMYGQIGRPLYTPVIPLHVEEVLNDPPRYFAIVDAAQRIFNIPDTLTMEDKLEVWAARYLVEQAFAAGAEEADIINMDKLLAAEETMGDLYQGYMRQSILELPAPPPCDINSLEIFVRNRASRWWEDDRSVNGIGFLPLGSVSVSYANIDNPRWAEYDISGRGYTHVKGYAGIADQSYRSDFPVTFQIHGDGSLLYEEILDYGEDAVFYRVNLEGVDKLRFGWFAETVDANGSANQMVVVEPRFLIPVSSRMLDAIDAAEAAIAALPENISLLDEPKIQSARELVVEAFALGVEREGYIGNLDKLVSAEKAVHDMYHELYEVKSLFQLGQAESANSWWFGRDFDDPARWDLDTGSGHTVNRVSYAPRKTFYSSYSNLIENPRWAEWDITGKEYVYVEGYAGISDATVNIGMPLELVIYGDGEPLFTAQLEYGRDAVFYRQELEGVEKLKFQWQAATEHISDTGGAERPAIVEPLFLHSPKTVEVISQVEAAIKAIPSLEDLTLDDRPAVEAARAGVNNALAIGAQESDLDNLELLLAAEEKIAALEAGLIDGVFGDVNGDGTISIADVVILLRHIAGLVDLEQLYGSEALVRARVSGAQGDPDINDGVLIMRKIIGLLDEFPVWQL